MNARSKRWEFIPAAIDLGKILHDDVRTACGSGRLTIAFKHHNGAEGTSQSSTTARYGRRF